jgi:small-conductance mechanosensitive channel
MPLSASPVAPGGPVQVFGVRLVGMTAASGRKLLLSLAVLVGLVALSALLRLVVRLATHGNRANPGRFWAQQTIRILTSAIGLLALLSIWFEDSAHLASVLGLVSAGLAIALQRFVTSIAAYFTILRGRIFRVGDRIVMGGVRGDVVELGFVRTAIMEMGQPPPVQSDQPAVWVEARQHTGRLVTITNDKIFDTPVYNYTRDFPYIWEELHLPVPYHADYARAERIVLDAAKRHGGNPSTVPEEARQQLRRHYFVDEEDLEPRVYWQLTDNWLELAVRFLVPQRGVRAIKDAMSRMILTELDAAGISIASGTYEIVGMPRVQVEVEQAEAVASTGKREDQAGGGGR